MSDFTALVDLACARLGGVVVAANDEFFAAKENLVADAEPVFREGEYTERGKWMDGWETRRRRTPGHDWALVRLGVAGIVRGVVVDTRHFRGNFPEAFALEAARLDGDPELDGDLEIGARDPRFRELLPRTRLAGDTLNRFAITSEACVRHVLLRIHPDGGVARLRVHGEVVPDRARLVAAGEVDLAAVEHGGRVMAASDMFFGHRHCLVYPGPPRGMFDGWETRRRRGPGHDWAVVRLGLPGRLRRAVVDTTFFKGNAPAACALWGAPLEAYERGEPAWRELLGRTPLEADRVHTFELAAAAEPVGVVRLDIFPDGGVARLRLFGEVAP